MKLKVILKLILQYALSCVVLAMMCIGCYHDLKTRTVSNKITGVIILLSLPLIYYNWENLTYAVLMFIALFFILFYSNQMGGADLKILVPIILIVPDPVMFMVMTTILAVMYSSISRAKEIPFFLPITLTYGVIIFNL